VVSAEGLAALVSVIPEVTGGRLVVVSVTEGSGAAGRSEPELQAARGRAARVAAAMRLRDIRIPS
jgi:hypothetical protein